MTPPPRMRTFKRPVLPRDAQFTSPQRGEVGLLSTMRSIVLCNPGEGPRLSRETVTPHPDRIIRCDPTSPDRRGKPELASLTSPYWRCELRQRRARIRPGV